MEESNANQMMLAPDGGDDKPGCLVCYDVSSSDSDNEMESTDIIKIKLEPIDISTDMGEKEIDLNDPSLVESGDKSSNEIISDVQSVVVESPVDKSIYRQPEEINLSSDSEEDSSESEASSVESSSDEKEEKIIEIKKLPIVKPVKKKSKDPYADETIFPPIEDLQISIEEDEAKSIGTIFQIVDNQVIVQAYPNIPPIDIDSVLFLESGKRALGKVFDVFGNIHEPLYVVIFNTAEQVKEKGIETGQNVYFAPESNEHTSYVIMNELLRAKGSDASWKDNREPPPNYVEYSDDEEERRAKQSYKHSKMAQKQLDASSDIVCCFPDEENTKKLKKENYNKTRSTPRYDPSNKSRTNFRNQSQNKSYHCENIFRRGPPHFSSQPPPASRNRFRSSVDLCDQSNNLIRPRFGGPPQFPIPPPSYSPFLVPPPSPLLRNSPSPNVCPPYLCSSPGPPPLWHGSMSPLPSGPPPTISPNRSSYFRNANQEPPNLFQVPPPNYANQQENNSRHAKNTIMQGQNLSSFVSQPNTSDLQSPISTSTMSSIAQYPPHLHSQLIPTTVMSHTGQPPPLFCPQRPPPITQSHSMTPQVLPPHLNNSRQLLNPSLNFLTQGPPPALPRFGPPSALILHSSVRPPSPYLLLQKSPPPQLQQVKETSQPIMQYQLQPAHHMSLPGCGVPSMPPNIPPPINYQVPPPPTNMAFNTCPPPNMSSSQGHPARFLTGPPLTNFGAAFDCSNRPE